MYDLGYLYITTGAFLVHEDEVQFHHAIRFAHHKSLSRFPAPELCFKFARIPSPVMGYSWIHRTQAVAVMPMVAPVPMTSSRSARKGGDRRRAAEVPHTPRTISASAHNTSRSALAEKKRSFD